MKIPYSTLILALTLGLTGCSSNEDDGWISLFNGKDLTGWETKVEGADEVWSVVDGVIDCQPKLHPRGDKALWTVDSYKDFELHVEWRLKEKKGIYNVPVVLPDGSYQMDANGERVVNPQPGADSGIYLRGTNKAQLNIWCWPIGSGEVYGYRNKQDDPVIRAGVTPKVNADNPVGEWNTFEITMKGDRLTVILNGKTVIENAQLPGAPEEGPIGLQHHGGIDPETGEYNPTSSLIQFRNLWVRPIDGPLLALQDPADTEEGWETLFNGQDLSGWLTGPNNKFVVENGELTVKRDNPDGQEHNLDYLWTEDRYGDFILDLEFKVVEGTNSGVFFRTDDVMDPVWTGLEVQVTSSHGRRDLSRTGTAGAIYDLLPPNKNAVNPPGEWNTY